MLGYNWFYLQKPFCCSYWQIWIKAGLWLDDVFVTGDETSVCGLLILDLRFNTGLNV